MLKKKFLLLAVMMFAFVITACSSGGSQPIQEIEEGQVADEVIGSFVYQIPEGFNPLTNEVNNGANYGSQAMGVTLKEYTKDLPSEDRSIITISSVAVPVDYLEETDDDSVYGLLESPGVLHPIYPPTDQLERTTVQSHPAVTYTYTLEDDSRTIVGVAFLTDGHVIHYAQVGNTAENPHNDRQAFLDSLVSIEDKLENDPPLLVENTSGDIGNLSVIYPDFLNNFLPYAGDSLIFYGNSTSTTDLWSLAISEVPPEYLGSIEGNDEASRSESALNALLQDESISTPNQNGMILEVDDLEIKETTYGDTIVKYTQNPLVVTDDAGNTEADLETVFYTFEHNGTIYLSGIYYNAENNKLVPALMDYILTQTLSNHE